MRLINTQTLELAEYFENQVPPYAILSHTWAAEEITFEEWACAFPSSQGSSLTIFTTLQSLVGPQVLVEVKKKAGYRKVRDAADLALRDGHAWIWVDTCCINKSSSAELSESINSMFAWYRKAEICYVYLADVDRTAPGLDAGLAKSRWFTRGWTLQELLAPSTVIFCDQAWDYIGDRSSLQDIITSITRIPAEVYRRTGPYGRQSSLDDFSIAQRMSWASSRSVTRGEDIAYCLLGMFGVNMPLLYGEGSEKAFRRLQIQIMEASNDNSLYAWKVPIDSFRSLWHHCPDYALLARHPSAFKDSWNLLRYDWFYTAQRMHSASSMASTMVRTRVFMRTCRGPSDRTEYEILLQCKAVEDHGSSGASITPGIQAVVLGMVRTGEYYIRSEASWRIIHVVSQNNTKPYAQATHGSIETIMIDEILGEEVFDEAEKDDFLAVTDAKFVTSEELFLNRAFISGFRIAEILIRA